MNLTLDPSRKRLLLFLPLLVLPFILLGFYAVKRNAEPGAVSETVHALNSALPVPAFKDSSAKSKLALYENQHRDSLNSNRQNSRALISQVLPSGQEEAKETADAINQKLQALDRQINRSPAVSSIPEKKPVMLPKGSEQRPEIDRLELMMRAMSEKENDPEL
ncbi:MAG: hypothetical protein INR69_19290, partial [Mucilaginibacter polytrichastri]|nr:hypothetical protein [Mucilaginibacter polytrichastri]